MTVGYARLRFTKNVVSVLHCLQWEMHVKIPIGTDALRERLEIIDIDPE